MKLLKNSFKSTYCACRYFAKLPPSKNLTGSSISKYVVVSESRDIFENLALEDWLYENYDFSHREILLLWRNTPAIVIGRHQNPWVEANVEESISRGIQIVRRNSGGGTVYHDLGNLNLSFLTDRKVYNRVHNLEIIVRSLKREWGIEANINSRSDIMMNKKKISGTASKLSRKNAYHHCTLLVDVNKHFLSSSLRSPLIEQKTLVDTKATTSKSAPTMNLREAHSSVNVDRLITIIGLEFLSTANSDSAVEPKGFHLVKPTNQIFPGIRDRIDEFKSWNWIYGRTPEFTITADFRMTSSEPFTVYFKVKFKAAVITDVNVQFSTQLNLPSSVIEHIQKSFLGKKYSETIMNQLKEMFYNEFPREKSYSVEINDSIS